MFLKGLWDQHRAQKWNREQLRKSFGKAGRTEYADGELNGIIRYFEKHPKDFQIDDITWNDLNLDEIFLRMNSTCSSAGQEYLYAMLRSPSFEEKEFSHLFAVFRSPPALASPSPGEATTAGLRLR